MKKLHLDLQVTNAIADAYKLSAEEISKLSGANLGNLVFRHALQSLVYDFSEYRPVNYPQAQKISDEGDVHSVLVSCANWLGTREQDERSNKVRADIIDSLNAPVISFGLGAQAAHGVEELKLGPESERLVRVLASKCRSLSVRDKLTSNTLRNIGIDNVVITGCPSNFLNLRPDLGDSIVETARRLVYGERDWANIRTCVSEFSGGHAQSGAILKSTLEFLESGSAFYVVQSPRLLPFLTGESTELPGEYVSNSLKKRDELISLLRAKALFFTSVDSWLDFSRTCRFSFGMRIHGTVVPIQAGVPSLLIGHDSRTSGLAEEMGVPAISPDVFLSIGSPPDIKSLIGHVIEKMVDYDETRARLGEKLVTFLQDNGLQPTHSLRRFIRQERVDGASG